MAAVRQLEVAAVDDALDLFDVLITTRLVNPARRATQAERLTRMPRLEQASVTLAEVSRRLLGALDEAAADRLLDVAAVWAAIEAVAPRAQVLEAVAAVGELVPDRSSGQTAIRIELARHYARYARS